MASGKNSNSSTDISETHSESKPDVTTQLESDANKKTYNILLLGETGVGKSTFINAFFHYLTYESLDDALKAKDITALVATKITTIDNDYNVKQIVSGEDENESDNPDASAIKSPRSYVLKIGNSVIRLIDTPGFGGTEGTDTDDENFDLLLATVGELKDIHAICVILKTNNSRPTVLFQHCVKQLFSRLERSVSRNIVFLFTSSRDSLYRPGDTMVRLREILKEIDQQPPNVLVPFQKENIFCIDNEAFRFLIANQKCTDIDDDEKKDFAASWKNSSKVYLSLLNYITKLKPHKIQDTVSINEARRLILRLSQPLAEIADNIDRNLELMRRHKVELNDSNKTIAQLRQKMYLPVLRMKAVRLGYPRTVCTHSSCIEIVSIDGIEKTEIYKTVCHKRCYLKKVQTKLIGDPYLKYCHAMTDESCWLCDHHYTHHTYITYGKQKYIDTIQDEDVSNIERTENVIDILLNIIQSMEERKLKLEDERSIILKSMAKFAHFLFHNGITYNDRYCEYFDFLIDREKSLGEGEKEIIESYTTFKKAYEEEKKILDDILKEQKLKDSSKIAAVTAEEVIEDIEELYKLELNGSTVKEFFNVQERAIKYALLTSTEKTYTPPKAAIPKLRNKLPLLFN